MLSGQVRGAGKTAASRLHHNEHFLASIIESSDKCIIGTDMKGNILGWNRGAEELLGYSPEEAMGRSITMLYPPNREIEDLLALDKFARQEHVGIFESTRVRKDGTYLVVSVVLSPIRDDNGELCGISAIYLESSTSLAAASVLPSGNPKQREMPTARPTKRLSVLLGTAAAGGTIATARYLGTHGLDVGVISSLRLSVAAWSRGTSRSYPAPPENEVDGFLARLLEIGAATPGQILLPTSDETAWMYTLHATELGKYFCLYQPSIETMRRIVDKKLFEEALHKAGMPVIPSWEPRTFDEAVELAPTLPYPVLIKPRTHVHRLRNDKGMVAHTKEELLEKYRGYCSREQMRSADNPLLPDASLPILQQFVDVEKEGVYSVTGFIDRSGELFVTRRSTKVFQRSKPVGVGVCFESRPNDPALSAAVRRLCRELNYFGLFEVEFLRFDDGWAAIDFNARLFNQVGMDIRRGMPLPLFACLDAAGEREALREAVIEAQQNETEAVFCDTFTLRAILTARTITGRISRKELGYWREWLKRHAAHTVDSVKDPQDRLPEIVHRLSEIYLGLRAFPRFLNSMPRVSAVTLPPATTQPSKVQS
jgi:PAS domain S-box-containing protein